MQNNQRTCALTKHHIWIWHLYMYAQFTSRSGFNIVYIHYHTTTQPHWPYMDIRCCIHDTCLVCETDPRSGCIIVYIITWLTNSIDHIWIFSVVYITLVCASDPRSGCISVYIHYHMTMQPYMDRVYASPAAQRLDVCAPFPYMCAGML